MYMDHLLFLRAGGLLWRCNKYYSLITQIMIAGESHRRQRQSLSAINFQSCVKMQLEKKKEAIVRAMQEKKKDC